jgi:uncharacterized protein YkwD
MKFTALKKTAAVLSMAGFMALSGYSPVYANTAAAVPVARTRAWDTIETSLGGLPESVRKIEYAGSTFYLGEDVTDEDFLAVLSAGPEAVVLATAKDSGMLYGSPVYILWDAEKTVLLVHPLVYDREVILKANIIPTDPPAALTAEQTSEAITEDGIRLAPIEGMTKLQTVEYLLSDEYTDAVRGEFYRLLNEHRAANGLPELEVNLELQEYADIRAIEQRDYFGHTRPDGSPAGSGWHNSYNVMGSRYAENAKSAATVNNTPEVTALNIFTRWKNSPGHNEHMLYDFDPQITMALGFSPEFDKFGVVSSGSIFATGY